MPSTLLSFTPLSADFGTAANSPVFAVRNGHRILEFADASDLETYFTSHMPEAYAGDDVDVVIMWMAKTAVANDAVFGASFERHDDEGTDLDADSFATELTAVATAPGTSGQVQYTTITFTSAQIDALTVGEQFRLKIRVIGTDSSHTISDVVQIMTVRLSQAASGGGGGGFFSDGTGTNAGIGKGTVPPTATGENAIAQGDNCNATAKDSFAFGDSNDVGGISSAAFGLNNDLLDRQNFFVNGSNNTTNNTPTANHPVCTFGTNNRNAIEHGAMFGNANEAPSLSASYTTHGQNHFVFGAGNDVAGYNYQIMVFGINNQVGAFASNSMFVGDDVANALVTQGGGSRMLCVGDNINLGAGYPYSSLAVGFNLLASATNYVSNSLAVGTNNTFTSATYNHSHLVVGRNHSIGAQQCAMAHGRAGTVKINHHRVFTANRNGLAQASFVVDYLQTSDATTTAITAYPVTADSGLVFRGKIIAYDTGNAAQVATFVLSQATGYRNAGAAVLVAAPKAYTSENTGGGSAAWTAQLQTNGNNIEVQVTGAAATTIQWVSLLEVCEVAG